MGVLNDKIQELTALEDEYKAERERVMLAIQEAIRSVGQNPKISVTNKNAFTINIAKVLDGPLEPEFYNWESQATGLIDVLRKRPVNSWAKSIDELLNSKSKVIGWKGVTVDKMLLSKEFLLEVKKKL